MIRSSTMDFKARKVQLQKTPESNSISSFWPIYVECEQFNLFLIFQESVKKKMSSLNLPTIPRLPSKAKFWKKRSANISDYDPTFRVIYLGNVLTGWAKGKIIFFQFLKACTQSTVTGLIWVMGIRFAGIIRMHGRTF